MYTVYFLNQDNKPDIQRVPSIINFNPNCQHYVVAVQKDGEPNLIPHDDLYLSDVETLFYGKLGSEIQFISYLKEHSLTGRKLKKPLRQQIDNGDSSIMPWDVVSPSAVFIEKAGSTGINYWLQSPYIGYTINMMIALPESFRRKNVELSFDIYSATNFPSSSEIGLVSCSNGLVHYNTATKHINKIGSAMTNLSMEYKYEPVGISLINENNLSLQIKVNYLANVVSSVHLRNIYIREI